MGFLQERVLKISLLLKFLPSINFIRNWWSAASSGGDSCSDFAVRWQLILKVPTLFRKGILAAIFKCKTNCTAIVFCLACLYESFPIFFWENIPEFFISKLVEGRLFHVKAFFLQLCIYKERGEEKEKVRHVPQSLQSLHQCKND